MVLYRAKAALLHLPLQGLTRSVRWRFQHLSCLTEVYLGCGVKNTSSWFSWKWYKWRIIMFFSSSTTVTGSALAVFRAHSAIVRSASCSAMTTLNSGCNVTLSWWMKLDLFAGLKKISPSMYHICVVVAHPDVYWYFLSDVMLWTCLFLEKKISVTGLPSMQWRMASPTACVLSALTIEDTVFALAIVSGYLDRKHIL